MAGLLFIVSQSVPARYTYLKHAFGSETAEVILDRRVAERRRRQEPVAVNRRRSERRTRDVTQELKMFGWALVRR